MLEDPLLHDTFVTSNGVDIVLGVIQSAFKEDEFQTYPDLVIPAISVLKNICLHGAAVPTLLSGDVDVYFWILRGNSRR